MQYSSHWDKIEVLAGLSSILEALVVNPFPCVFQLLEVTGNPLPRFSKPAMLHCSSHSS